MKKITRSKSTNGKENEKTLKEQIEIACKNNEKACEELKTECITANQMRELAKKSWKELTFTEIAKRIKEKSKEGELNVNFYNAYISEETRTKLLNSGFKVEENKRLDGTPYISIAW